MITVLLLSLLFFRCRSSPFICIDGSCSLRSGDLTSALEASNHALDCPPDQSRKSCILTLRSPSSQIRSITSSAPVTNITCNGPNACSNTQISCNSIAPASECHIDCSGSPTSCLDLSIDCSHNSCFVHTPHSSFLPSALNFLQTHNISLHCSQTVSTCFPRDDSFPLISRLARRLLQNGGNSGNNNNNNGNGGNGGNGGGNSNNPNNGNNIDNLDAATDAPIPSFPIASEPIARTSISLTTLSTTQVTTHLVAATDATDATASSTSISTPPTGATTRARVPQTSATFETFSTFGTSATPTTGSDATIATTSAGTASAPETSQTLQTTQATQTTRAPQTPQTSTITVESTSLPPPDTSANVPENAASTTASGADSVQTSAVTQTPGTTETFETSEKAAESVGPTSVPSIEPSAASSNPTASPVRRETLSPSSQPTGAPSKVSKNTANPTQTPVEPASLSTTNAAAAQTQQEESFFVQYGSYFIVIGLLLILMFCILFFLKKECKKFQHGKRGFMGSKTTGVSNKSSNVDMDYVRLLDNNNNNNVSNPSVKNVGVGGSGANQQHRKHSSSFIEMTEDGLVSGYGDTPGGPDQSRGTGRNGMQQGKNGMHGMKGARAKKNEDDTAAEGYVKPTRLANDKVASARKIKYEDPSKSGILSMSLAKQAAGNDENVAGTSIKVGSIKEQAVMQNAVGALNGVSNNDEEDSVFGMYDGGDLNGVVSKDVYAEERKVWKDQKEQKPVAIRNDAGSLGAVGLFDNPHAAGLDPFANDDDGYVSFGTGGDTLRGQDVGDALGGDTNQ